MTGRISARRKPVAARPLDARWPALQTERTRISIRWLTVAVGIAVLLAIALLVTAVDSRG